MTAEALQLPHRLRVAWVISVVEWVVNLYSPHARTRYLYPDVLEYAWSFAEGAEYDKEAWLKLARPLEKVISRSKRARDGYNDRFRTAGMCVLNEISDGRGVAAPVGVVGAATAFAAWQLYRQGVSDSDLAIPSDYFSSSVKEALWFARDVFERAKTSRRRRIHRDIFRQVALDLSLSPLAKDVLARVKVRPPVPEVAFLQESLSDTVSGD
jgi:hypothetical protein